MFALLCVCVSLYALDEARDGDDGALGGDDHMTMKMKRAIGMMNH